MDTNSNAPRDQSRDESPEIRPQHQSSRLPEIATDGSGASKNASTSPSFSNPFASVKTSWDRDSLILSWLEDDSITLQNRHTLIEKLTDEGKNRLWQAYASASRSAYEGDDRVTSPSTSKPIFSKDDDDIPDDEVVCWIMTAEADRNRWLNEIDSSNHACTNNNNFLIFDFRPSDQPRRLDGSIHDTKEKSEGADRISERMSG